MKCRLQRVRPAARPKLRTGLALVVAAALALQLTTAVMYYTAKNIITERTEQYVQQELNAVNLGIRDRLTKVEEAVDNTVWVVERNLAKPDSMYALARCFLENNTEVLGSSITFVPYYYPQKGCWFEPYVVRSREGSLDTMQLGSAAHDYRNMEFYVFPTTHDSVHWCEPYLDSDGARAVVTTYSAPVHDASGKVVAVVDADISLDWLHEVVNEAKVYTSTQRFLVSRRDSLLSGSDNATFRRALKAVKADSDRKGYVTMTNEAGEELHVFFYPVGGLTDWTLINVCTDEAIFGHLRDVRRLLALLVLVGLLPIGIIVYRTSRNTERMRRLNAEKERIGSELRVASRIQQSMLPPQHLREEGVEVCGSQVPAREVGGDLFDYFLRDEKLFFCIGDVSGKGTPSALLMAMTHALFRAMSAHENNPARIMRAVNEASCRGNEANMFVTLFIGVLDLPTGHLRYCNAGHDCPVVISGGTLRVEDCIAHLPIGVFDDVNYGMQELQLKPAATLFLYTDGLTEAKNGRSEQFGMKRVEKTLKDCAREKLEPAGLIVTVGDEVRRFVGGAEQSDDLTMLAIRYTPQRFDSVLTETLVLKNDIRELPRFGSFMKSVTERLCIEPSLARRLRLAVEEAVVNVIDYAYPAGAEGEVTLTVMSDGHSLKVKITDGGVPFDPTMRERADTTLSAEERQIGGLGILLVRELMDTINYERADGRNILTLVKKLK